MRWCGTSFSAPEQDPAHEIQTRTIGTRAADDMRLLSPPASEHVARLAQHAIDSKARRALDLFPRVVAVEKVGQDGDAPELHVVDEHEPILLQDARGVEPV